jgi:hypothetical protein
MRALPFERWNMLRFIATLSVHGTKRASNTEARRCSRLRNKPRRSCFASPPGLPVRLEPVAATEGKEQSALPRIGQPVVQLHVVFAASELLQPSPNPLRRTAGGLPLSVDLRPGM